MLKPIHKTQMPHRILKFNDLISILKHKHSKNRSTSKTLSSKDNIIQKSTWQKVKNKLTEFKNAGRSFSTAGHRPELAGKHPSSGWPSWGLRRMKKWRKRSWKGRNRLRKLRKTQSLPLAAVARRSPPPETPENESRVRRKWTDRTNPTNFWVAHAI